MKTTSTQSKTKTLIQLYNEIQKKINQPKKANPNDKPNDKPNYKPNKNLEKIKNILENRANYEDLNNINFDPEESSFVGALKEIEKDFPEEYGNILKNLMKNDMEGFIKEKKPEFDKMCKEIIEFLENAYNNTDEEPSLSLDDIINIENILNSDKYQGGNNIVNDDEDEGLNPFLGAWAEFKKQYLKIYEKVNKALIKGEIEDFLKKHNNNIDAARKEILDFLKNFNNEPKEEVKEEGILTDDQYNEIKKIMKDKTINPKQNHRVISDSLRKLYGSWDLIEEKYPKIAKEIKSHLFGNHDDFIDYAIFEGDPANGYETIRQNIIEFVHDNFYKKEDKDMGINEKIPEDYIYKLTVEEIYETVTKSILESNLEEGLANTLYNNALDTLSAYKDFLKLMENVGINEGYYAEKANYFKIRLLDILKEFNLNKDIGKKEILKDIENILNEKIEEVEEINLISNIDPDYHAFKKSWKKIEDKYPEIAKYVLDKLYKNDMDKLEKEFSEKEDESTRKKIFDFIKNHFSSNKDNNAPNQQGGNFEVHKVNIGTNKNNTFYMTNFMEGAITNAKRYIETIQKKDENLAKGLNERVYKINKTFTAT